MGESRVTVLFRPDFASCALTVAAASCPARVAQVTKTVAHERRARSATGIGAPSVCVGPIWPEQVAFFNLGLDLGDQKVRPFLGSPGETKNELAQPSSVLKTIRSHLARPKTVSPGEPKKGLAFQPRLGGRTGTCRVGRESISIPPEYPAERQVSAPNWKTLW